MVGNSPRRRLLVTILFSYFCVFSSAQTAVLSGFVKDSSLAALPGSTITVTNQGTGVARITYSNHLGYYNISFLPPGIYSVRIEAAGFQTTERSGITLSVADRADLDFVLPIATRKDVVAIRGDALDLNTESAVGTTVDQHLISGLPLNGRTFQSLITLAPGVVPTRGDGQFSVNGQRDDGNYFSVDGVSANVGISAFRALGATAGGAVPGFNVVGGTNNLVSIDAMQEFRIQTSTYSAEFGRTPGGQVQIVTRSGTNRFDGSVFDYFRNDALDANDWFADAQGLPRAHLRQEDFGGVFGGPFIKDKAFFFASYEGLRLRQPQFVKIEVPSVNARALAPGPIAQLLRAFPLPNGAEDPATMIAPFSVNYSNPISMDAGSVRIDQQVTNKLMLFGRFSDARSGAVTRVESLTHLKLDNVNTSSLTVGATLTATPAVTNEFRANYTRNEGSHFNKLDNFGGAVPPPDSLLFPVPFASPLSSRFIFTEAADGLRFVSGRSSDHVQRQLNVVDGLSVLRGSHALKVGADYRHLTPIFGPQDYGLQVGFDTLGDAVTGETPNASIFVFDELTLSFHSLGLYAQDTWRRTARLAVSYGLRWEFNPAPSATGGLYTLEGLNDLSTARVAPPGTAVYRASYGNFAPRVGLAYQAQQHHGRETVVRGGFGVFYDLGTGVIGDAAQSYPHRRQKTVTGLPFPLANAASPPPVPSLQPPYSGQSFLVFDPDTVLPRTYQWNLGVQQSLGNMQMVSASYVGAVGRDLLRRESVTGSGPNFIGSSIDLTTNTATSDYHALQLQFQRRLSRGLQAQASYSWAHSIDIASNDFDDQIPSRYVLPALNRGSSDFDVRHSFSTALTYVAPRLHQGVIGAIFHDWSIDGLLTARTATPVDVTVSRRFGVDSVAARPDSVPGVALYLRDATVAGGQRINPAAFVVPIERRQGNLHRNTLRGLSAYQLDLSLNRTFKFTERVGLMLRADSFNVLNHPSFADPSGLLGSFGTSLSPNALFGAPTAMLANTPVDGVTTGLTQLFRSGGPRSLQLSVRLNF